MDVSAPDPAHGGLQQGLRKIARNLGWLLASRGVLAVLSLVYLGIATRTLGIADFGRFALITGAAQAIAVLVGFQTWQIVIRYGVDHLARGDERALARLMRGCAWLDLASAVAGSVLAAAILLIWGDAFGITPPLMRDTLIFAVVQLMTIRSTPTGILRLRDRFSLSALADSVTPVVRFVGAGAALLFHPTIQGFLLAWAVAELLTAGAYWLLLARTGDLKLLAGLRVDLQQLLSENPGLLRFVFSTNANSTLGMSTKQLPLLLVGGYLGPAAAGAFRLALQLAQALAKFSQLLARAAFPEIVRAVRGAPPEQLPSILAKVFGASSVGGLAILFVVAILGRPMLTLIGGASYGDAYFSLLWLATAGCLDLATVGFEPVLLAVHRAGTALIARSVAVVAQLVASLALLPTYDAPGASMGVFAGSLTAAILLGGAIIRYTSNIGRAGSAGVVN